MRTTRVGVLVLVCLGACIDQPRPEQDARAGIAAIDYPAKHETVPDFAALIRDSRAELGAAPAIRLDRVTSAVPWPRGLAWVDGQLVVLARGRHRRAGGVARDVADTCGSLFLVDPEVAEPVVPGQTASGRVGRNATLLTAPTVPPFHLYRGALAPADDRLMDRPYCTLIYDKASRNLFICGYSGADLPGSKFRKNATDSILRFDLRSRSWLPVELHDASVVPPADLGYVVPNVYYPHHDTRTEPPPHGWLNGPDGGCVAGGYLYCAGKDNHALARYDLKRIRADAAAGPPASRLELGPHVVLRYPGGSREVELLGPSAAAARDHWLYIGYRTSSVIVRYRLEDDGSLVLPPAAELIAVFEPWRPSRKRSANLIDIAFNSKGELYVSCAKEGRVWKVGVPNPEHPFLGDDQCDLEPSSTPLIDLRRHTGKKTGCGNILFDDEDRLYVCVGTYDSGTKLAGAVYRATEIR